MKENTWLTPAWKQRGLDALKRTVDSSPELKNAMITFLRDTGLWDPDAQWSTAVSRFNACLRPADPERFQTMHLWALMKEFGEHTFFLAMADDLGYEVRRKSTEERQQELLERIAVALEQNAAVSGQALRELGSLGNQGLAARMNEAFKQGAGSFSLPAPGATPRDVVSF